MSDTDTLRQSLISLGLLPNPDYDNFGCYAVPGPPEDPRVRLLWDGLSHLSRQFMFLDQEHSRATDELRELRGKLAKALALIDHVEATYELDDVDKEVFLYVRGYTAS